MANRTSKLFKTCEFFEVIDELYLPILFFVFSFFSGAELVIKGHKDKENDRLKHL